MTFLFRAIALYLFLRMKLVESIDSFQASVFCEKNSSDKYRRPHCINMGQYVEQHGQALSTTADGFFTYSKGTWKHFNISDVDINGDHGWYWDLPSPCSLFPISAAVFSEVVDEIHKRTMFASDDHPRVAFIGDSITNTQINALLKQFKGFIHGTGRGAPLLVKEKIEISFARADNLEFSKETPSNTEWVQKVCSSDISFINYGAHAHDIDKYNETLVASMNVLFSACGREIKNREIRVYFRTTPEGNPLCEISKYAQLSNMSEWNKVIWPILSRRPVPNRVDVSDEKFVYFKAWTWDYFQQLNQVAFEFLQPRGIQVIDIVAMSRLRPTMDWHRPGNGKSDCLHHNKAVFGWNDMLVNVLAADLCSSS